MKALFDFFFVHNYGLSIAIGAIIAYAIGLFLLYRYRKRGLVSPFSFESLILLIVGFGILGARALFIFYNLPYFIEYPLEIPAIWHGGWVWHGGLIGGGMALLIYSRIKKISFFVLTDILVPGLALAQGIGRWGNYFNQELYGKPTDLPWAVFIDPEHRLAGFEIFSYFHPAFLYESLWSLILFIVLFALSIWFVAPRGATLRPGLITALYLLFASVARFGIEFIRIDEVPTLWGLRAPQWIAFAFICISIAILLQRRKKMV